MEKLLFDVVIIGAGPAGLTAAIYTSRAFLKTLVLAGNPTGGQLTETTEVENFPGFKNGVQGPELISNMREQAEKFETRFVDENVVKIEKNTGFFSIQTDNDALYEGKTVILATGASANWLGLESETRLRGKGVSACATCDGFFFKGKAIAVVGGGDAAMEEAIYLTKFASDVTVLVRGSKEHLRASKIMRKKAFDNPKINFMFNTSVQEVLGDNFVTGVRIENSVTKETAELHVRGLFVAIGHSPNTGFLKNTVALDEKGYVVVTNNTQSSVEGIFVAGDVSDHRYRQAITAAGAGCMASIDVEKYLASKE